MREAFQADERAGGEQVAQTLAVRQLQVGWRQLSQRIQHKRAQMHLVVRHLEARLIDQAITEQQDIQVQGARAPAFQAFAALIVFDGLQRIE